MKALCVVGAVVLTLVTACGGGSATTANPPPAPPTSSAPGAQDQQDPVRPAEAALSALQATLADLDSVEVDAVASGVGDVGRRHGVVNLVTGEFSATLDLGDGAKLKMLSQADLTWTMAPPSYWVRLGYTARSAKAARGKWVVAQGEAAAALRGALDPGAVIRAVLALEPASATGLEVVRQGDLRGRRALRFQQPGAAQSIFFTRGDRPRLLRVVSTVNGIRTVVDFNTPDTTFHVRLPRVEHVVQP